MEQVRQKYVRRKVDELTPHPSNPRQGDVGAIHGSIEANGFYGALVVQKSTGYILAGNHRLQAAVHAGATSVPVIEVDVDDETATRILLADNRTNDLASYDEDALAALLTGLAEAGGLDGTGYDGDDVDRLLADVAPPDDDATPFSIGTTYEVVIECENEQHQKEILERLSSEGLSVRAFIV